MRHVFDLPQLDDSNSILMPPTFNLLKHESQPSKEAAVMQKNSDQLDQSKKYAAMQQERLPTPFGGNLRSFPRLAADRTALESTPTLPAYTLPIDDVFLVSMTNFTIGTKFDAAGNFDTVDERLFARTVPIGHDSLHFCDISGDNNNNCDPDVAAWRKTLSKTQHLSMHRAAKSCVPLFDARSSVQKKMHFATQSEPHFVQELSELQPCVLTSSRRTLAESSLETAFCESPLINTFVAAVHADSAVSFAPHWLRQAIDLQLHRYRNTSPVRQALHNEQGARSVQLAKICVEDTAASTAGFKLAETDTDTDAVDDATRCHWAEPSYYYSKTARFLAHEIVARAAAGETGGQQARRSTTAPLSEEPSERMCTVQNDVNRPPVPDRTALETALCSMMPTRIASLFDGAKALQVQRNSFMLPHNIEPSLQRESKEDNLLTTEMLGVPDNLRDRLTTLPDVCKVLQNLHEQRALAPPIENAALIAKVAGLPMSDAVGLPEHAVSLQRVAVTGSDQEWRALLDRLKREIAAADDMIGDWLAAMLWFVVQLCELREIDDGASTTVVNDKDRVFLRARLGAEWLDVYAAPQCETREQKNRAFVEQMFWLDKRNNRVGGLALLLLPLDTCQLMRIENRTKQGDSGDKQTSALRRSFLNAPLLRAFNSLVPVGVACDQLLDMRTASAYKMISKHYEISRRIVHGICGYTIDNALEQGCLCLQPVVAAFDYIEGIEQRLFLPRLPNAKTAVGDTDDDNATTLLDWRLERFLAFPYRSDSGKLSAEQAVAITSQRRSFSKDNVAGYGEMQVGAAFAAHQMDQVVYFCQFEAQLNGYAERKQPLLPQKKTKTTLQGDEQMTTTNVEKRGGAPEKQVRSVAVPTGTAGKAKTTSTKEQVVLAAPRSACSVGPAATILAATTTAATTTTTVLSKSERKKKRKAEEAARLNRERQLALKKQRKQAERLAKLEKSKKKKQQKRKQQSLVTTGSTSVSSVDESGSATASSGYTSSADDDSIIACSSIADDDKDQSAESRNNETFETDDDANVFGKQTEHVEVAQVETKHMEVETERMEVAHVEATHVEAEQVKIESVEVKTELETEPVEAETEPIKVAQVKTEPVEAEIKPVEIAQVKTEPVKVAQIKTEPVEAEVAPVEVEVAQVKTEPVEVAQVKTEPVEAEVAQVKTEPVEVQHEIFKTAHLDAEEGSIESSSSSTNDNEEPPLSAVKSQLASVGRLFAMPDHWRSDDTSLQRQYMQLDAPRQYAGFWMRLADRSRPMTHKKHRGHGDRRQIMPSQLHQHIAFGADETMTFCSVYGLLLSIVDNLFSMSRQPQWQDVVSVLVGGSKHGSPAFVNQLARGIIQRVEQLATSAHIDGIPVDQNTFSGACMVCKNRYRSNFYFVPQSIDYENTVATRLVALCDSIECSDALLTKMAGVLVPPDFAAAIPGLRVFFRLDGSIGVYESERDAFKMWFCQPPATAGRSSDARKLFDASDFAQTSGSVVVFDQQGNSYALPPKVAEKAYYLACSMRVPI